MSFECSYGIVPLVKEEGSWNVLVILRNKGFWEFPKGHAEENETAEEAAERELKEETDLDVVSFLEKEPLSIEYTFDKAGIKIKKHAVYFLAEVKGVFQAQEGEATSGEWLSLEEAVEKLTFENSKDLCQKVIELLKARSR